MDATTITTAVSALKLSKDIFTSILAMKIESAAKDKIYEAMTKLGEAQDALFSLREILFELQNQNKELRDRLDFDNQWNKIIAQYSLTQTEGGAVVLAFTGSPPHYACPSCANQKCIQILQDRNVYGGNFDCHGCKSTFIIKKPESLGTSVRISRA